MQYVKLKATGATGAILRSWTRNIDAETCFDVLFDGDEQSEPGRFCGNFADLFDAVQSPMSIVMYEAQNGSFVERVGLNADGRLLQEHKPTNEELWRPVFGQNSKAILSRAVRHLYEKTHLAADYKKLMDHHNAHCPCAPTNVVTEIGMSKLIRTAINDAG